MKRLRLWLLAAVLCLGLGLALSCGSGGDDDDNNTDDDDDTGDDDTGDDDAGDDDEERDVSDLSDSGCLSGDKDKDDEGYTELLALDWDGSGAISVEHGPTCNNCEFKVEPTYAVEGDKLIIREHSQADFIFALCDCLFEYSYDLTDVPAGDYTLELYTVYHGDGEGEQRLNFTEQISLTEGQPDQLSFSQNHEGMCI